jgi:hypothetical protein
MIVLYWVRQFFGISCGMLCGLLGVAGSYGFILFTLVNVLGPFFYYRHYANINIDDFGPTDVLSEGFQPSFGLFCLIWIIVYTAVHTSL